ncbi:MAG TPA: hypothetical protein VEC57_01140 [Candidatus Limnocylindrales bacterium]|nr:hypothetical protein [Candidatus Limnocylindrales bacterium]
MAAPQRNRPWFARPKVWGALVLALFALERAFPDGIANAQSADDVFDVVLKLVTIGAVALVVAGIFTFALVAVIHRAVLRRTGPPDWVNGYLPLFAAVGLLVGWAGWEFVFYLTENGVPPGIWWLAIFVWAGTFGLLEAGVRLRQYLR